MLLSRKMSVESLHKLNVLLHFDFDSLYLNKWIYGLFVFLNDLWYWNGQCSETILKVTMLAKSILPAAIV